MTSFLRKVIVLRMRIQTSSLPPTTQGFPILLFQSPFSRAINVGYIQKNGKNKLFIPGRLNYGTNRMDDTAQATNETLKTTFAQKILTKYQPKDISTLVIMREALSCNLPNALKRAGVNNHYGDAFIGATHVKGDGKIRTDYRYENTEGLTKNDLWVAADSICMGRSFIPTLNSLFSKGLIPKEILFIMPIGSRRGMEAFSQIIKDNNVKASFISWGALFGVGKNLYDMPWGHPDTEVLDPRDKEVFVNMYSDKLCVGGDFGNYYFAPYLAEEFYQQQLKDLKIKPRLPSAEEILSIYKPDEILVKENV